MIQINPRISQVKESATLAINQKVQTMRSQGQSICHLGFGQAPFNIPKLIQESLKAHAHQKNYLPGSGLPELCQAVANYYHSEFDYQYTKEHILIGPGSKELLFQLFFMLEGPVLIPQSSWVSYGPQMALLNKPYHIIDTYEEDNYCLKAEELEAACLKLAQKDSSKQKILIINTPNNPTGAIYPKDMLIQLAEICSKYNIIVISDEIYANIDFNDSNHTSIAHYYPQKTIVTGGLSKLFSAGGYRLGVCLIPEAMQQLYQALKVMISETYSCVSSPIQYAALTAYSQYKKIKPYLDDCTKVHKIASLYLYQRFINMGLSLPKPQGAFYLFPNFKAYQASFDRLDIKTNAQLANMILEQTQVALLPGEDFYRNANEYTFRAASTDYNGQKALEAYQQGDTNDAIINHHMRNLVKGCNRLEEWLDNL
ncbi:aminotransferase class I/II-fold pyridoxal phosphate-dependent enzyme [Thiotrichales bacterium 19X7-9]|nr:aminotransferase class I/II-fold pyridoxal phosphate-dependent enzyme [Thiotrichales bacterium 19X7-9]